MEVFTALCGVGIEKVTANELRKLLPGGGPAKDAPSPIIDTSFGKVRFKTDTAGCYRALMGLRSADRLLWEGGSFMADNFDDLFEGIRAVPWERYVKRGMSLVVDKVRSNRSKLQAVTSIQGVVHKAAAERLCEKFHIRRLPDEGPQAMLRIYVEKDRVEALLDLSGDPLFKRGYRQAGGIAPLRESTAAALLLLSGWKRKFPLYDPFSGSGTIAIEAALYAGNVAPGLERSFALGNTAMGDRKIESAIREELRSAISFDRVIRIYGSDSDAQAVKIARSNLRRALEKYGAPSQVLPSFSEGTMEQAVPRDEERGYIITNPPYGIRLGDPGGAEEIYQAMGDLGRRFSGYKLGVITDHAGFESFFGRKADSCREIMNGLIKSYFYQYDSL